MNSLFINVLLHLIACSFYTLADNQFDQCMRNGFERLEVSAGRHLSNAANDLYLRRPEVASMSIGELASQPGWRGSNNEDPRKLVALDLDCVSFARDLAGKINSIECDGPSENYLDLYDAYKSSLPQGQAGLMNFCILLMYEQ